MTKLVELHLKRLFIINVDNIEYIQEDGDAVTIGFTSGTTQTFDITYKELKRVLSHIH